MRTLQARRHSPPIPRARLELVRGQSDTRGNTDRNTVGIGALDVEEKSGSVFRALGDVRNVAFENDTPAFEAQGEAKLENESREKAGPNNAGQEESEDQPAGLPEGSDDKRNESKPPKERRQRGQLLDHHDSG